jgi:hypothetical protein
MKTIFSDQAVPDHFGQSLFLAGPTPRSHRPCPSWRPLALSLLQDLGFQGTVCIPEPTEFGSLDSYDAQVEWEWRCLHGCSVIAFWVPRELELLPGFTTNVEFGFYIDKKPVVYGRPEGSPKCHYLDWLYSKVTRKMPFNTLREVLESAIELSH